MTSAAISSQTLPALRVHTDRMPLSEAEKARINANRQKALALRAAREEAAREASPITSPDTAARAAAAKAAVCGRKDQAAVV